MDKELNELINLFSEEDILSGKEISEKMSINIDKIDDFLRGYYRSDVLIPNPGDDMMSNDMILNDWGLSEIYLKQVRRDFKINKLLS